MNLDAFVKWILRVVSILSLLFPLFNTMRKPIPLAKWPEGGLAYFLPEYITYTAILICAFFLLTEFAQRTQIKDQPKKVTLDQAFKSFVCSFAALLIYLLLHTAINAGFYFQVLGWESGDIRRLLGDVVLLITYSIFFAMITRTFALLSLVEFLQLDS
jgi:hypothetical protein